MGTRAKGRALWLPDVLRDAGLPVEVAPGWEHAGRDPREWIAITDHHTASSRRGGPRPALGTVVRGRPDVPPRLANMLLDRNGVHVVTAAGIANHAGVAYLPLRGGISSGVNGYALGREIELDGVGEPFPPGGRQYEAMSIGNAAICTYLGLDPATAVWDHKSICRPRGRKIDVRPYDLADGRARVARRMTGRPIPTPTTPATGGFLMALTDKQQQDLYDRIMAIDLRSEAIANETTDGANPNLGGISKRQIASLTRLEQQVADLKVQVATLQRKG